MHWWLILGAVIVAALVYAHREHKLQSRSLAGIFADLSARHGGTVRSATFLTLPQYRFERNDRKFLVTSMATSGQRSSGPFTFVDLDLPFDTGTKLQVVSRLGLNDQLLSAYSHGEPMSTGSAEFDSAFRVRSSDQRFAHVLLHESVRSKFMDYKLPRRLDVRVDGPQIKVRMDGFAQSQSEIEELIELATLLADHCPTG